MPAAERCHLCKEQPGLCKAKRNCGDRAIKSKSWVNLKCCLKDKEPVARQGVVPTALKCQHLSCSVARIHYLFWVRQPENIPLVRTGDSKPGSSAGCMPFVYTLANLLQHEARVQVSGGLIAELIHSLSHPEMRMSSGQCS